MYQRFVHIRKIHRSIDLRVGSDGDRFAISVGHDVGVQQ